MYAVNLCLKRFLDIAVSLIALIVLMPLFAALAIAVKCDSRGPVFFVQERRTKHGRVFRMYKFRSMVVNAESMGAGLFNFEGDPRVTRVGRLLRSTSLDELPQLWNVLRGDLSLVGPRPCVRYELGDFDTLNRKYKKRFEVRGGITGLAQVKGRNENSWEEKVEYDNEYIEAFKRQGLFLDMKILFATVLRVFRRQDIYEEREDSTLGDEESARRAEEEIIRVAHLTGAKYE